MSENTGRAWLQELDKDGGARGSPLHFDFNPESLRIEVSAALSSNASPGRSELSGNGQSSARLSFEATFDNTGPSRAPLVSSRAGGTIGVSAGASLSASAAGGLVSVSAGASASFSASASLSASASIDLGGGGNGEEALDVRLKTGRIAGWVSGAEGVSDARTAHVEFRWGRLRWRGAITSFSETIDYFSPSGTPLRSKVSVTLTEATVENRKPAEERKREALSLGLAAGASLALDFSAGTGFGLGASGGLGAGLDLAFSANAGVSMSADVALGVFGGAAASAAFGAGADLSATAGIGSPAAGGASTLTAPPTPSTWAPNGPPAGTVASATASAVLASRASGGATALPNPAEGSFRATGRSTLPAASGRTTASQVSAQLQAMTPVAAPRVTPVPVLGAPPRSYPLPPEGPQIASPHGARPADLTTSAPRRPRWERLPPSASAEAAHASRCGCARCGGGT